MARVTNPFGRDLGEKTGAELAYYRREPGYVIDGAAVAAPAEAVAELEVEADEVPRGRRGMFGEPAEDE